MLVITRKPNQAVIIELPDGRKLRVILLKKTGYSQYRLGFECPLNFSVYREELKRVKKKGKGGQDE